MSQNNSDFLSDKISDNIAKSHKEIVNLKNNEYNNIMSMSLINIRNTDGFIQFYNDILKPKIMSRTFIQRLLHFDNNIDQMFMCDDTDEHSHIYQYRKYIKDNHKVNNNKIIDEKNNEYNYIMSMTSINIRNTYGFIQFYNNIIKPKIMSRTFIQNLYNFDSNISQYFICDDTNEHSHVYQYRKYIKDIHESLKLFAWEI